MKIVLLAALSAIGAMDIDAVREWLAGEIASRVTSRTAFAKKGRFAAKAVEPVGGRDVCADVQLGVPTRRREKGANLVAVPLVDTDSQNVLSTLEIRLSNKKAERRFSPGGGWTEIDMAAEGQGFQDDKRRQE